MAVSDAETTKMVRSQIGKRYVDASLLDVRVSHGVVYLRGVLRTLRTHAGLDLNKEMEVISTVLRSKPGVREVVWEATIRT